MADSTNPFDIPQGQFPLVAGYVDGIYAWSDAGWLYHTKTVLVGIAVFAGTNAGQVLDVETGDATPAQAVDWVLMRRASGVDPSVYIQLSRLQELLDAFAARGVARPHLWVAAWDNSPTLYSYSAAHQYANPTLTGFHYDLSAVVDYWPGVDPPQACSNPTWPATLQTYCPSDIDYIIHAYTWAEIRTRYGDAAFPFIWNWAHPGQPVQWPGGGPPPSPLPAPTPPPSSASAPPLDQTRSAWSNLADFFTTTLPAAVQELLRLLGLFQKTP